MRLLHVIDTLGRGGAERVVVSLSKGQRERGHEVTVVSLFGVGELGKELRDAAIPVIELCLARPNNLLASAMRLARRVDLAGYGAVIAHLPYSTLAVAALPKQTDQQRISVLHNLGVTGEGFGAWAARMALGVALLNRIDTCIAVSRAAAVAWQTRLNLPRQPQVIFNPVDVTDLAKKSPPSRDAARAKLGLDARSTLACVVSKFSPEKGIDILFHAISLLSPEERPTFAMIAVGPLKKQLETLARGLGVEASVRMLGAQPPDLVYTWIKASDFVVLPSRAEGLPMVVLEAMALGTPVVATAVGGVPECIGSEEGWLVSPESPEALAAALRAAANDGAGRSTRASAASAVVATKFSLPEALRGWDDLLAPTNGKP